MKVQETGLSTEEKKSSQITLTSKLKARAIQQLELFPHGIRMVAMRGTTRFFFYKNNLYKKHQAEIRPKNKNNLRNKAG